MVLQRVESEDAALAAQPLNTPSAPTATVESVAAALSESATATPTAAPRQPSPTTAPATEPTRAPFSGPVIAEPPAVPRILPANVPAPVVAPAAPRGSPTADKPRNLETSKPEPPSASIATSTPGTARTALPVPTAVRQPTPARATTPTVRTTPGSGTPLPTLALPRTSPPRHPVHLRQHPAHPGHARHGRPDPLRCNAPSNPPHLQEHQLAPARDVTRAAMPDVKGARRRRVYSRSVSPVAPRAAPTAHPSNSLRSVGVAGRVPVTT